jgi:hypothetical protein
VLPLLTAAEAEHPSFHVVAPSLPGFAWSEAASKRGFDSRQYAEVRTPNNLVPFHTKRYISFLTS